MDFKKAVLVKYLRESLTVTATLNHNNNRNSQISKRKKSK